MSRWRPSAADLAQHARARADVSGFLDRPSLNELIFKLGVEQSDRVLERESGYASCRAGNWKIGVDSSEISQRQMFTLAHELGHVLYPGRGEDWTESTREEGWCNRFAAELLMPRALVCSRFRNPQPSLEAAVILATCASVSLTSAFIRLDELLGWNSALLGFRADGQRWRMISAVGLPKQAMIALIPDLALSEIVSTPVRRPKRVSLPFRVRGEFALVKSELHGARAFRWALVSKDIFSGRYEEQRSQAGRLDANSGSHEQS